jgi:hypothetical protein
MKHFSDNLFGSYSAGVNVVFFRQKRRENIWPFVLQILLFRGKHGSSYHWFCKVKRQYSPKVG